MDPKEPVCITYYYYNINILTSNTTSTFKDPIRHLKGTFSILSGLVRTIPSLLVSVFGLSRCSHVLVKLQFTDYTVYLHSMRGEGTQWSPEPPHRQPDRVLVEFGEIDTSLLDQVLPSGEHYSIIKSALSVVLPVYRHTPNCVTVVHRLRFLMGKETRRRTPGGLYREIRKQVLHQ